MSTPGTNWTAATRPCLPLVAATTAVLPAVGLSSLVLAAPASAAQTAVVAGSRSAPVEATRAQAAVVPAAEIAVTVPSRLATPAQTPVTPEAPKAYTVRAGETVTSIAGKYGLDVAHVLALNGLTPTTVIRPGQELRLTGTRATEPGRAPSSGGSPTDAPRPDPTTTSYTIRPGDTPYGISARLRVPLGDLLAANGLSLSSVIYAGRTIKVPAAVAADRAKPASNVTASSSERVKPLVEDTFMGFKYPEATVASANENKKALNASPAPNRDEMKQIIADTARRMGVDPALALAFAYQESGFSQRAVSPANAIGAMQLVPSSGQWASDLIGRRLNLLDPRDNATAGVAIIRALVRTSKDEDTAIAGYYQGQYSVAKHGLYDDTKQYVAAVKSHKKTFE
ncbi:hypothetical protein GCM10027449_33480 [Sinomonas notoginsengisoli]|uniref:lytic transglycosylase domain-containing protein n=1 Tax=Sinomonas notoginsengisoli TaxID=1457311 RepID=UPI001F1B0A07|nr:lytic transglycosylase domain-containing protein [Sinomonas notoginsengisoli]